VIACRIDPVNIMIGDRPWFQVVACLIVTWLFGTTGSLAQGKLGRPLGWCSGCLAYLPLGKSVNDQKGQGGHLRHEVVRAPRIACGKVSAKVPDIARFMPIASFAPKPANSTPTTMRKNFEPTLLTGP
jgi:hypothetical protein